VPFQILEYTFFAGVAVVVLAIVLMLGVVFQRKWKRLWVPLMIGVGGIVIAVAPAVYTQAILQIDLGPREKIVDGQRHLTLTGWDGESYEFLQTKTDTVVLQMANPAVDDNVLRNLKHWHELRELDLNDTLVTDAGLEQLELLTTLVVLRLRNTKISQEGLERLLTQLTEVRQLDVRGTQVDAEWVQAWKAERPGRRVLF
jgi:hypothetical protein